MQREFQGHGNIEALEEAVRDESTTESSKLESDLPVHEPEIEEHAVEVDTSDEEPEAQVEEKKSNRTKLKTRINQVVREKFQVLDELEKERQKTAQLMSMLEMNNQTAAQTYENSVVMQLEAAKKRKLEALDSQDPQAILDADINLAMATNDYQRASADKTKSEIQRQYNQQYNQQQQGYVPSQEEQMLVQENTRDWLENNPWFSPESNDYDERLAMRVDNYSKQLERLALQHGRADLIGSEQYYDQIDEYVNKITLKHNREPQHQGQGEIRMKSRESHVAPARSPMRSEPSRTRETRRLTQDERDFARRMGIKDEELVRRMEEDKRIQRQRGRV